jgi:biotin carboxyl carrier protein
MENEIVAPRDGTVSRVAVNKGASVNTGDLLVVL